MKLRALAALVCLLPLAATSCSGDDTQGGPADAGPDGTRQDATTTTDTGAKDQQTSQPDVVSEATPNDTGTQPDVVTSDGTVPDTGTPDVVADVANDVVDGGGGADAADTGPDVVIPPDENAQLNLASNGALAKAASDVDAKLLGVLPNVAGVINMFISEDSANPTLAPSETDESNAARMVVRLVNALGGTECTDSWHGGNAIVYTDFSDCIANGLRLKGRVQAEAKKPGSTLTVEFTFTDFSINGVAFANTSTVVVKPTGTAYPTDMNLVVDGVGTVELTNGTATVSEPDGGRIFGISGGTGTLVGAVGADAGDAGMPILTSSANGWNCTQKSIEPAFTTTANLTSALGDCLPNAGTVTVTRTFDCHKNGVLHPDQTVVASSVLQWLTTTPSDGKIKVTPDSDIGDAGTASALDITLVKTCDNQIITPEVQPEAGPDAEPDAADAAGE